MGIQVSTLLLVLKLAHSAVAFSVDFSGLSSLRYAHIGIEMGAIPFIDASTKQQFRDMAASSLETLSVDLVWSPGNAELTLDVFRAFSALHWIHLDRVTIAATPAVPYVSPGQPRLTEKQRAFTEGLKQLLFFMPAVQCEFHWVELIVPSGIVPYHFFHPALTVLTDNSSSEEGKKLFFLFCDMLPTFCSSNELDN
jgi:hypothetical protein